MDFQNRAGSKPGSGGVASHQHSAAAQRERLRKLGMETIDLNKDPYMLRNHQGTIECKLCLTIHNHEGSYLAHTQGKKHQTNIARRAAREEQDKEGSFSTAGASSVVVKKRTLKIGRPGYKVTKFKNPETGERSLKFTIHYPEIEHGLQPRHRIMSAFEQQVERPDKNFQYIVFAADPYETIAFKVPSLDIKRDREHFITDWDKETNTFTMRVHFGEPKNVNGKR